MTDQDEQYQDVDDDTVRASIADGLYKHNPGEPNPRMRIWDPVWKTDPEYTKRAGRVTAIDAYYKIGKATRHLGPAGEGWGWEVEKEQLMGADATRPEVLVLRVLIWWRGDDGARRSYQVYGASRVLLKSGAFDVDAPKKALTDAITKGLSYLGFSADVFLGKFDSNQYVEARRSEVAQERRERAEADMDRGVESSPPQGNYRYRLEDPADDEGGF